MKNMTKNEAIARMAVRLERQRLEIKNYKSRLRAIRVALICVGGPLNDNVLKFNPQQMKYLSDKILVEADI